jgi:Transmembrane secretion effector
VRGAVFAAIPLAAAAGGAGSGQVYATAACYGLLKMIGLAGFPAMIPQLVSADLLPAANALEGAGFGVAAVAGSALAGAMLGAGLHPAVVIAADAASYFVLVVALLLTRVPHASPPAAYRQPPGSAMREVIGLAVRHPVIRDTTIMFALFNVGEGALLIVLAHQAHRTGLGAGGYGWLIAAMAGGELAAAVVLLRVRWRAPLTVSILVAQLAAAAAPAGLLPPSRLITVLALIMLGFCTAPMTAWAQTLRMRAAPPAMHGRLFALLRTMMQATPPAGAALAGILLHAGVGAVVIGIVTIIAAPALVLAPDLLRSRPAGGMVRQPRADPGRERLLPK